MKILLIGNFAPPYEEENLHNISLYGKLEEDGHDCTAINISEHPAVDARFIDSRSNIDYVIKLMRHSVNKDVIHFLTKGYLRVGLLKLMLSIFAGALFRTKKILTIHSEFFSILGQMRSPFGGTQTLNTSFYLADRIIFTDRDTYETARMYMKKNNFELVPSFVYVPEDIEQADRPDTTKMKGMKKALVCANAPHPSFLFEVLTEILKQQTLPDDTGIIIALSGRETLKPQQILESAAGPMKDRLIFIELDDLQSSLRAFAEAGVVLHPMTCDGAVFFESFALCVKKVCRAGNLVHFPGGMVLIKDGETFGLCAGMLSTLFSDNPDTPSAARPDDFYKKILSFYEE